MLNFSSRAMVLGAVVSVFAIPATARAKFICKQGKVERSVEVTYADAAKKAPCEVKYQKEGDEPAKTIFTANNEVGFCEKKAQEFSEKLKGMNFECAETTN